MTAEVTNLTDRLPAIGSNSLPMLAETIRTNHRACEAAKKAELDRAIDVGRALLQAKNIVVKTGGSWLIWVRDNCEFTDRTAERYMKIAKAGFDTGVSDLSLRRALKDLTQPKTRPTPPTPRAPAASPPPPKSHPAGEAAKGRMKSKRRIPGAPPLKQNFIPNVPGYLEELLLAAERCVVEYEMPTVDATAKAIIAHRIQVSHFEEIISWLTRLKDQVHREETQCGNTSSSPTRP